MPAKPAKPTKKHPPAKTRGAIPLPESDLFGNKLTDDVGVLNLPITVIEPDPNQARWLLPPDIRAKFVAGEVDAAQALERWRKQVERLTARLSKTGQTPSDVPEARKFEEIAALATSIRRGGQVNPITVVRYGEKWRIETGERRFWAHQYLVSVIGDQEAVLIPATPRPTIDPFRQAVENLHAAPLNAIGTAREVARLLMATNANPAPGQDSRMSLQLDDYRKIARERVSPGGWKPIEEAMGKSADHLARYLRLLLLPDEVLHLADRNDLSEKHLRPLTELKEAQAQIRIAQLALELKLSSADVEALCRQPDLNAAERELRARLAGKDKKKTPRARFAPGQILYNRFISFGRFVESVRKGGEQPAQALAQHFLADKGDAAETELSGLIRLLEEAMREIRSAREAGREPEAAPGQESPSGSGQF